MSSFDQTENLYHHIIIGCGRTQKWVLTSIDWLKRKNLILFSINVRMKVTIPRIILHSYEIKWSFVLKRKQLPIHVCHVMTLNKSQWQSLKYIGVCLSESILSHRQLNCNITGDFSRGLKFIIQHDNEQYTRNIVYKEVFNNLPMVYMHSK